MIDVINEVNPANQNYPFSNEMYNDRTIVYHGTSNIYCSVIESQGFIRGFVPFNLDPVKRLVEICGKHAFHRWSLVAARGLSTENHLEHDGPRNTYFSANFWYAREYAQNLGGETIHNALKLCSEFRKHLAEKEGTDEVFEELQKIETQLFADTAKIFPVVYAVKVESCWFDKWIHPEGFDVGSFTVVDINLSCRASVPPDRILAKVNYLNGALPGYCNLLPSDFQSAVSMPSCRPEKSEA